MCHPSTPKKGKALQRASDSPESSGLVMPTPEYTPAIKPGGPAFTSKRSYDVMGGPPRKKMKLVSEHDDEDLSFDSDASTDIASDVEGDFYKASQRSQVEHAHSARQSATETCVTPEKPKRRKIVLESPGPRLSFASFLDEQPAEVSTPPSKMMTPVNKGPRESFVEPGDFNPAREMLLVGKHGKRKVRDFGDTQFQPRDLLNEFHHAQEETTDEDEDSKEARLIQEAAELDNKGFDIPEFGNYLGDEGYSEDEAFEEERRLTNYFERARSARRVRKTKQSPTALLEEEDEDDEDEEEYLKKLLEKLASETKESSKEARLRNKRLMRAEDDNADLYSNFGFTLSELSSLNKSKKIFVFEDPKEEASEDARKHK